VGFTHPVSDGRNALLVHVSGCALGAAWRAAIRVLRSWLQLSRLAACLGVRLSRPLAKLIMREPITAWCGVAIFTLLLLLRRQRLCARVDGRQKILQ
jgi:hypothetical protein